MATVYSGYSDGWKPSGSDITKKYRTKLVYSTSSTDTTYTISASVAVNINSSVGASYSAGLNLAGTSYTGSGKTIFGEDKTVTLISTKSKSIAKTHSAQTVTVSGKVKSSNGSWDGNYVTASASISIPAKTSYTINYRENNTHTGTTVNMNGLTYVTKWYGEPLTLSTTQPFCNTSGTYIFKGWATSEGSSTVAYTAGGTYSANSGATLYAVWEPVVYTLTFNYNYQENGSTPTESKSVGYNQTYGTLPTPTRPYYIFDGWWTEAALGEGIQVTSATTMGAADTTVYAHWRKSTKTVTYVINSPVTAQHPTDFVSQTADFDVSIALSGTTYVNPARYGYEFLGWATSPDSQTADFILPYNYTGYDSITLYPVMELVYDPPVLTNIAALRAERNGPGDYTENDTGRYGFIKFNYNMFTYTGHRYGTFKEPANLPIETTLNSGEYTIGLAYNIFMKDPTNSLSDYIVIDDYDDSNDNISRNLIQRFFPQEIITTSPFELDEGVAYDIKIQAIPQIIIYNSNANENIVVEPWEPEIYLNYIGKAMYILDVIDTVDGLAVGKVSTESNLFDVGWNANFDGDVVVGGTLGFKPQSTAPTEENQDGLKIVVLDSEPANKYDGWLYFIKDNTPAPITLTLHQCTSGSYTRCYKIGNIVYFSFNINVTTATSGYDYITGLPPAYGGGWATSSGMNVSGTTNPLTRWWVTTDGALRSDSTPTAGWHNGNITYICQ